MSFGGARSASTAGNHGRSIRAVTVVAAAVMLLRRASLGWGAAEDELDTVLPGDDLLPHAHFRATRAITVRATPGATWPWIAQLGQGRGGFYSYDFIENLIGCDIHSSDRIVEEWQNVAVGDQINLAPGIGLTVALVDPGRALVLHGGIPVPMMRNAPYDFTWAFVLRPGTGETTRLLVRERYTYAHRWVAALVEPVDLISFVMSRRMMRGVRQRAERCPRSGDRV